LRQNILSAQKGYQILASAPSFAQEIKRIFQISRELII